jgi:hypothetical protein
MRKSSIFLAGVLLTVGSTGWAHRLEAQSGYLFRPPVATISVRLGGAVSTANDPLHRFFMDELTLERKDFAAPALSADLGISLGSRVDLVGGIAHSRINNDSEFKDWVDANDLPIEQTTTLERTLFTLGTRIYFRERGRSVSRFAWVPKSFQPYIGGGGGVTRYELEQSGWFVDFEDLDIFEDFFSASGTAATAYAVAGAEWWPIARLGLSLEGRYSYARSKLQGDFFDFDHIDLSGFQLTAGLSTRF